MFHERQRWIEFHDLIVTAIPDNAPAMALDEIMNMLMPIVNAGQAFWLFRNKKAGLRVKELKFFRKYNAVGGLLTLADGDMSDPAFQDIRRGDVRIESKKPNEGVAFSSHFLISLLELKGKPNQHLMMIEEAVGFGQSRVRPMLSHLMKKYCKYVFADENKENKNARPTVVMAGHPSETLKEAIRTRKISGIELTKYEDEPTEFDEKNVLKVERREILIRVSAEADASLLETALEKLRRRALEKQFAKMRVILTSDEGKTNSHNMSVTTPNALNALTVRSQLIEFDKAMQQCVNEIREDVIDCMGDLMIKERRRTAT